MRRLPFLSPQMNRKRSCLIKLWSYPRSHAGRFGIAQGMRSSIVSGLVGVCLIRILEGILG